MELLNFDEINLAEKLTRLSPLLRAAFAAACAQKLAHAYSTYAIRSNRDPEVLNHVFALLWNDLNGTTRSDDELESQIETAMALIPKEEDEWIAEQAAADDAAAALAYALRCRRDGSVQDAVWAARRAYNALDDYIITQENIDTHIAGGEERILNHPLMQTELFRQARDLEELYEGTITIEKLRQRSTSEAAEFFSSA